MLKHELKITNIKWNLRNDPRKIEYVNADLRASLGKKTFVLQTLREDHEEVLK